MVMRTTGISGINRRHRWLYWDSLDIFEGMNNWNQQLFCNFKMNNYLYILRSISRSFWHNGKTDYDMIYDKSKSSMWNFISQTILPFITCISWKTTFSCSSLRFYVSYLMVNTNILFFDSETRTFLKYIMIMPVASPSSCVLPEAFSKRHIEERTRTVQKDLVVLNIWCLLSTLRHPLHLFLSPFIAANCCPNKKSVIINL